MCSQEGKEACCEEFEFKVSSVCLLPFEIEYVPTTRKRSAGENTNISLFLDSSYRTVSELENITNGTAGFSQHVCSRRGIRIACFGRLTTRTATVEKLLVRRMLLRLCRARGNSELPYRRSKLVVERTYETIASKVRVFLSICAEKVYEQPPHPQFASCAGMQRFICLPESGTRRKKC